MRMLFASDWIHQLLIHQTITKFIAKFTEKIRVSKANKKLIFRLNFFKRKLLYKLYANQGANQNIRTLNRVRQCISFMHIA